MGWGIGGDREYTGRRAVKEGECKSGQVWKYVCLCVSGGGGGVGECNMIFTINLFVYVDGEALFWFFLGLVKGKRKFERG